MEKYNLYYDPEYKTAMDYELWTRVLKVGKMVNLPEVFLLYRWNGENLSISQANRQKDESIRIRKNIVNFLTADADKIRKLYLLVDKKLSFGEKIFSIRNSDFGKVLCLLGLRITLKKRS